MTSRGDVVAEARRWMGTPFHHQGRRHAVGVDCAGLVIGVARELSLVSPDFDITGYRRDPDGFGLLAHCDAHMRRITRDDMGLGDVLVIRWAQHPQHLGIVADYRHGGLSLVHAYQAPGKRGEVVEHRLAPHLMAQFVAAYRLPGVA